MDNALEIHAHYSKLFEAFAVLPVYDIRSELDKEAAQHFEGGLYREWRIMLQRLKSYLGKSILDSERHEAVKYYIDRHEPLNEILLSFPECRFPLRETDRVDLKARFVELINCPDRPSAGLWVRGANTRTPEEIQSQCPPILDEETIGRADVIKQRLALLDEWKSHPDSMMLGYNEFAPFPRILSNGQVINQYPISAHPAPQAPAVAAAPTGVQSAPAVALTPAERACVAPFTLDEAAALAHRIGLTDASGTYCLDPRKLGAVVGFCQALQHAGKLRGAVGDLTAVVGPRLGVEVKTRKTTTGIAKQYYALTEKALT